MTDEPIPERELETVTGEELSETPSPDDPEDLPARASPRGSPEGTGPPAAARLARARPLPRRRSPRRSARSAQDRRRGARAHRADCGDNERRAAAEALEGRLERASLVRGGRPREALEASQNGQADPLARLERVAAHRQRLAVNDAKCRGSSRFGGSRSPRGRVRNSGRWRIARRWPRRGSPRSRRRPRRRRYRCSRPGKRPRNSRARRR